MLTYGTISPTVNYTYSGTREEAAISAFVYFPAELAPFAAQSLNETTPHALAHTVTTRLNFVPGRLKHVNACKETNNCDLESCGL